MKLTIIAAAFALSAGGSALFAQNTRHTLLIGAIDPNKGEGIYTYDFDSQTGTLAYKNKTTDIKNPSYLAISANSKFVYSVSSDLKGSIYAYSFDAATGALKFLNKQPSGGDGPCYVSTDKKGTYVFAGNYNGGSLEAIPLNKDGSLGDDLQPVKHEGSSINKLRQSKPFVHSVVLSPDEKYLFAQDLGTDKISAYKFASQSKPALSPAEPAATSTTPGGGPRHLTFHPNGKFAYLIQEMGGLISSFSYKNGKLTPLETVSTYADGFEGLRWSADIHVSPDGKFVYGSNRTTNELAIFAIGHKTGKLSFAGRQSTIGKTPRNFAIDPSGNYLLAANQETNDIYVFKRDKQTGLLTPTGTKLELGRPVCLKFLP